MAVHGAIWTMQVILLFAWTIQVVSVNHATRWTVGENHRWAEHGTNGLCKSSSCMHGQFKLCQSTMQPGWTVGENHTWALHGSNGLHR